MTGFPSFGRELLWEGRNKEIVCWVGEKRREGGRSDGGGAGEDQARTRVGREVSRSDRVRRRREGAPGASAVRLSEILR